MLFSFFFLSFKAQLVWWPEDSKSSAHSKKKKKKKVKLLSVSTSDVLQKTKSQSRMLNTVLLPPPPVVKAAPTRSSSDVHLKPQSRPGVSLSSACPGGAQRPAELNSVRSAAVLFYPSHFSVLWLGVRKRSPPISRLGWALPATNHSAPLSFLLLSHTSWIIDSYLLSFQSQLLYMLAATNGVRLENRYFSLFIYLLIVFNYFLFLKGWWFFFFGVSAI